MLYCALFLCGCACFSSVQCFGSECLWEAEQSRGIRHGHGRELRYCIQIGKKKSITINPCHSRRSSWWDRWPWTYSEFTVKSGLIFCSLHSLNILLLGLWTLDLCFFFFSPHLFLSIFFPGEKVMPDKDLTCDLFRFLQLLCEGHNSG